MHENNFLGLLLVWDVHSVVSAETVNEEIVSDCTCDNCLRNYGLLFMPWCLLALQIIDDNFTFLRQSPISYWLAKYLQVVHFLNMDTYYSSFKPS